MKPQYFFISESGSDEMHIAHGTAEEMHGGAATKALCGASVVVDGYTCADGKACVSSVCDACRFAHIKRLNEQIAELEIQLAQDFRNDGERITLRLDDSRDIVKVLDYIVLGKGRRIASDEVFNAAYEGRKGIYEARSMYGKKASAS